MADVRGASGAPAIGAFGGTSAATPSTPLYVDLSTGDLYVVINNAVTLVGAIPGGANYILSDQVFSKHVTPPVTVNDSQAILATKAFIHTDTTPQAVFGQANDILSARVFSPRPLPAMWS